MKIKVSETTNTQLDWLVAKCEGIGLYPMYMWGGRCLPTGGSESTFYCPSEDWAQGGPILERERIELLLSFEGHTRAILNRFDRTVELTEQHGSTHLIAAMRCFVASRLGNEVEVPEELL